MNGKDRAGGQAISGMVRERRDPFAVLRADSAEAALLLDALLPDPDRLVALGEKVISPWTTVATDKVRVVLGGESYFLKSYNPFNRRYRLRYAFRTSRAVRAFLAGRRFLAYGVPTPEPLVCLEERRFRMLGRSYLMFPFTGRDETLLNLWPRLDREERKSTLANLAGVIGRMHHRGILHGDLNWRNILIAKKEDVRGFYLVDLDRCRFMERLELAFAEKDLEHFLRDLRRSDGDPELEKHFLDHWRRAAESSGGG